MRGICLLLLAFMSACSKGSVSVQQLSVQSSAFQDGGMIPQKYTCDGEGVNPPLKISDLPKGAKSFVLILEDRDAKGKGGAVHWIVFNIPPDNLEIPENTMAVGLFGTNTIKKDQYWPPCPPAGEEHRYLFQVYALDAMLDLNWGASREEVKRAMKKHILAEGKLTGKYKRPPPAMTFFSKVFI